MEWRLAMLVEYAETIKWRWSAKDNLYPEPGTLTIDLKETGYDFGIEIKSSKSQGVSYMKVFCYDMVLLELGKMKSKLYKWLKTEFYILIIVWKCYENFHIMFV